MKTVTSNLQTGNVLVGTIVASCLAEESIKNYPEWLICNGQNVPNNCELYSYMPKTPNLCGRTLIGQGSAESGTNYTLGQTGGEEVHKLTEQEMPTHEHTYSYKDPKGARGNFFAGRYWAPTTANGTTNPAGGGCSHNNMQPYYAVNYIIYIGKMN